MIKIGQNVLEHYEVPLNKVKLIFGDFYNLKFQNNYLDFVFLSAAFHHADDPNRLLLEIKRILKPEGIVIIIGEHIREITLSTRIKHYLSFFISKLPVLIQKNIFGKKIDSKSISVKKSNIFEPDSTLGDHYYTLDEYKSMFLRYGFIFDNLRRNDLSFQSFVMINKY